MFAAVTLFSVLTQGQMTKKMLLKRAAEHIRSHLLYSAHPADPSTAHGVCKASGIWEEKSFWQPCISCLPALCASDRKIAAAGWL